MIDGYYTEIEDCNHELAEPFGELLYKCRVCGVLRSKWYYVENIEGLDEDEGLPRFSYEIH